MTARVVTQLKMKRIVTLLTAVTLGALMVFSTALAEGGQKTAAKPTTTMAKVQKSKAHKVRKARKAKKSSGKSGKMTKKTSKMAKKHSKMTKRAKSSKKALKAKKGGKAPMKMAAKKSTK